MVQARLLPEARTWHVAELLLSGTLRRVPGDTEAPALVRSELELGTELRRELLSEGTKGETAWAMTLMFDSLASAVQGPLGQTFGQLGESSAIRVALPVSPWKLYHHGFPLYSCIRGHGRPLCDGLERAQQPPRRGR
ncbi:hypothetical protein ACR6C2_13970 [Streptomyces sp. INA 01156]